MVIQIVIDIIRPRNFNWWACKIIVALILNLSFSCHKFIANRWKPIAAKWIEFDESDRF